MKKADRCCIDCIHFEKEEKECHRYPPFYAGQYHALLYDDFDNHPIFEWPTVDITNWCGEFKEEQ